MLSIVSESPTQFQGLRSRSRHSAAEAKRITGPRYIQCNESIARLRWGLVPNVSEKTGHLWLTESMTDCPLRLARQNTTVVGNFADSSLPMSRRCAVGSKRSFSLNCIPLIMASRFMMRPPIDFLVARTHFKFSRSWTRCRGSLSVRCTSHRPQSLE
eukprot:9483833-Pyramimonas_sp.AAC.1